MYRKEVNEKSPLRILERSIHGGLGKGNLGVIMGRTGSGKTPCLVQIGLDDLMRDRAVLHISLGQRVEHVQSYYDHAFETLAAETDLADRDHIRLQIAKNRMINSYTDKQLDSSRLLRTTETLKERLGFAPSALLVDRYPFYNHTPAENRRTVELLKMYAKELNAELWLTVRTHREDPSPMTACGGWEEMIDVALYLEETAENGIALQLLKDHGTANLPDTHLMFNPETGALISDDQPTTALLRGSAFTLLSGGAEGAESEFGVCAEKWGAQEETYSFAGRTTARTRGLIELNEQELARGAVSRTYLQAHMHRRYPDDPDFLKVLQSIWHQVNTAGQVFIVGQVLPDGTIKGGTGWAAELGRHLHKPVFVYDQEQGKWFQWRNEAWRPIEPPRIVARRFCGGGTRNLNETGKRAILNLFIRSFGEAK